jgi:tetratricopeptide (TPR) repeat protein
MAPLNLEPKSDCNVLSRQVSGFCYLPKSPNDWANKEGRDEMVLIYDGKTDEAIKLYQKRLVDDPNRQEALFGLAVAHAKKGEGEQAMTFVTRALGAGLPFERFTAGPREMLESLHGLSAFKALKNEKNKLWIHGPILGAVTDSFRQFLGSNGTASFVSRGVVSRPAGPTFQNDTLRSSLDQGRG